MARVSSQEECLRWETIIRKQQISGLSIARWCRENKVLASTFHYWKGKRTLVSNNFLELTDQKQRGIIIERGNFRISVESGFDSEVLRQCLALLREVC